jgi:hypothetical protein
VRAAVTTRAGGISLAPFATLNLAHHVGDSRAAVAENRRRVDQALGLPAQPYWLRQVHGTRVARVTETLLPEADAAVAFEPGQVCAVLTADCLPVFLADASGTRVGIAHAGWRGLVNGVIEATVSRLACHASELVAWLGPAIGPEAFEVGEEVREAFVAAAPQANGCFVPSPRGRWLADLYSLARQRLEAAGVRQVHGGGLCTYADSGRFFSYRRDGECGRMASLIWLE